MYEATACLLPSHVSDVQCEQCLINMSTVQRSPSIVCLLHVHQCPARFSAILRFPRHVMQVCKCSKAVKRVYSW